mgnify:CR=1 FL=1
MAQITDLGFPSQGAIQAVQGINLLMVEANHDPAMLRRGPYPSWLKKRVAGPRGHLSNHQCGCFLRDAVTADLQMVILGHLSKANNTPPLAVEEAQAVLSASVSLSVATQGEALVAEL